MKYVAALLLLLLPLPAHAVKLAVCDANTYDVRVRNAGSERIVRLSPRSSPVEEFGPAALISFQIEGQREVRATTSSEEFCIWSGRITVQKMNPGVSSGGGWSLR